MNHKLSKKPSNSTVPDGSIDTTVKYEPPDGERSDDSDSGEGDLYKNLTEDQLLRAKKFNECFICQKRCSTFATFRRHVLTHTTSTQLKCEKCFKEFAQLKYLKAHLKTHNENRSFTCDICKQNFATKPSIRGHMRVHTGEKPYKCSVCNRAFSESSTRRKHMQAHFPALECPICFRSFARDYSLRDHILTHNDNPREHICEICFKGFLHRSSLLAHQKTPCAPEKVTNCASCVAAFKQKLSEMEGDSQQGCKICGLVMLKTRDLSIHLRTHMADPKFQCTDCANKSSPNR